MAHAKHSAPAQPTGQRLSPGTIDDESSEGPGRYTVALISPYSGMSALGLRLISACLRRAGWQTRLIFLPNFEEWLCLPAVHQASYPEALLGAVCEACGDADLVGVSVMTNFVLRARSLTQAIHERLGVPVIWGGIHATARPAECLQWADMVCVGEGELAMVELVRELATGGDTRRIANIWSRGNGSLTANPPRPLLEDLDLLPLPDYEVDHQLVWHQGRLVPLDEQLLSHYMVHFVGSRLYVTHGTCMTRGCPYACTFCASSTMNRVYPRWRHVRCRSPEAVIAEIEYVRRVVPTVEVVKFQDDTLLALDLPVLERLAELYQQRIGLPFLVLGTPQTIEPRKLECLVQAGLRFVEMGIQSGSRRTLKLYGRPPTFERILEAARCLQRFRRWIPCPRYDVISDNPYETPEDEAQTLRLLASLPRPFRLHLFALTFYPGTALHERARQDGWVQSDEQDVYRKNFLDLQPTYYNLLLWAAHRHIPTWLLVALGHERLLAFARRPFLQRPIRFFWQLLRAYRTWALRRAAARVAASASADYLTARSASRSATD